MQRTAYALALIFISFFTSGCSPPPAGSGQPATVTSVPPAGAPIPPPPFRSITLADEGQTIRLKVGEQFLLNLGPGLDWTAEVADQSILSRVFNVTVIVGFQGIYRAEKSGQTNLTAVGDPPCRKSTPPCLAPSRMFRITVVVE